MKNLFAIVLLLLFLTASVGISFSNNCCKSKQVAMCEMKCCQKPVNENCQHHFIFSKLTLDQDVQSTQKTELPSSRNLSVKTDLSFSNKLIRNAFVNQIKDSPPDLHQYIAGPFLQVFRI